MHDPLLVLWLILSSACLGYRVGLRVMHQKMAEAYFETLPIETKEIKDIRNNIAAGWRNLSIMAMISAVIVVTAVSIFPHNGVVTVRLDTSSSSRE